MMKDKALLILLCVVLMQGCGSSEQWPNVPVKFPIEFPAIALGEDGGDVMDKITAYEPFAHDFYEVTSSGSLYDYEIYVIEYYRKVNSGSDSIRIKLDFLIFENQLVSATSCYFIEKSISFLDLSAIMATIHVDLDSVCIENIRNNSIFIKNSIYEEQISCDSRYRADEGSRKICYGIFYKWFSDHEAMRYKHQ